MKTLSVKTVIMSHLSDAERLIEMDSCYNLAYEEVDQATLHIEFAKYLVLKFVDRNIEIDPDAEYKNYLNCKNI